MLSVRVAVARATPFMTGVIAAARLTKDGATEGAMACSASTSTAVAEKTATCGVDDASLTPLFSDRIARPVCEKSSRANTPMDRAGDTLPLPSTAGRGPGARPPFHVAPV